MPFPAADLSGRIFGRWRVVRRSSPVHKCRAIRWECVCDCGAVRTVLGATLRRGESSSCGCLQKEQQAARHTKHGAIDTKEYSSWKAAIARCERQTHKAYRHYGARGIYVCAEWRHDFPRFLADMGPRPVGMTLDRIDMHGPYAPWNCRWATIRTQARNTRQNRFLTYNGETLCVRDWAERIGVTATCLYRRLNHGQSPAAVLRPKGQGRRIKAVQPLTAGGRE